MVLRMKTSRAPLTEVQQNIYNFVRQFIRDNGFSPTIREIMEHFKYRSSNSVVVQLNKMKAKGYITNSSKKGKMKVRTLRLVDDVIGIYSVESKKVKQALKEMKEKGYDIKINEAVELLSALNITIY